MELPQRLKRNSRRNGEYRGCACGRAGRCKSLTKQFDLFHFLILGAELAEFKILARKLCLPRAPFNYKHGGAGLALLLCLHLRRGPKATDLPQPVVEEFLL